MIFFSDPAAVTSGGAVLVSFKGAHGVRDMMLPCVRWSVASPLSDRQSEALLQEGGVSVDHTPINRWVLQYTPQIEAAFHRRKRPVWRSWRRDDTSIGVKGQWRYLYRAVDNMGQTIDVLLTEPRDEQAATRFLTTAMRRPGIPEAITIDGSQAHAAAIREENAAYGPTLTSRPGQCLHPGVEQDQRAVNRVIRPARGGQSCAAAQETLAGVELMPMRKQGPLVVEEGKEGRTPAEQGYALAASSAHRQGQLSSHGLHTKICDRVSPLPRSSRPLDQRRRSSLQGPTHEISRQYRILSLTL
jgi:putative transposase